ncbi:protein lethal(2)essential for life [Linepithema humile]|uniref:protein lethal(2)essential for life n=1 Tax=Linepithema humile TaxID=83485 RepID=UPI00351E3EEA
MSRYRATLIPKLFSHWWETLDRPHRLLDQRFAMRLHPDHFFGPSIFDRFDKFDKQMVNNFSRSWNEFLREHENGWSVVKNDEGKFHVSLDVQQFKPDEVNVKVIDNIVVVEGKHEEKKDEHGLVSRHFVRKYMVPEQCDPEKIMSTLSSDGVLTITAPMKPEAVEDKKERVVNIEHTGKPAVENEPEVKQAAQN